MIHCFVAKFCHPMSLVVVMRGTTNLPTTPWIWDGTILRHDHLVQSVTHAYSGLSFAYLSNWQLMLRSQLAISFMSRYPSNSANFHIMHTRRDLHHLLTGLQQQMYPCVRKLVLVVSCECEWAILRFVGIIVYEIWASRLCSEWSAPNQCHCNFLARLYCLPCSQWPLLEW